MQFLPAIAGQTDKCRACITAIGFCKQGSHSAGLAVSVSADNDQFGFAKHFVLSHVRVRPLL